MSASPYSSEEITRSAVHFLAGKTISALLTLTILFWVVRLLTIEEYSVYVTLIAGMEIILAIVSLGLPWVAARYLPEFLLYASDNVLKQFIWKIIGQLSLFLIIGLFVLLLLAPWLLTSLDLPQYTNITRLFLLVVLVEGVGRNVRDCILGPLLLQGLAQTSLIVRNLILILLIGVETTNGVVYLHNLILIELTASILGTLLALIGLIHYLQARGNPIGTYSWKPKNWKEMLYIARHMYFNHMVTLAYSPQLFILLIQRYVGHEAAALFGFLRSLYSQIANYLPATLLFSVIRPMLIASYVGEGGIIKLTRNANLAGKLSLFILLPVLIVVWFVGDELLNYLSGEKFSSAGYYFCGLLLALIPFSQRQILETVAVATDKSHLCSLGGALGVVSLLLVYGLFELGFGLWAPIIAIISGQLIFNSTLVIAMGCTTSYRPDTVGFVKLVMSALVGFIVAEQIKIQPTERTDLFVMAILACGIYLVFCYLLKTFQSEERIKLNQLLRCRVF